MKNSIVILILTLPFTGLCQEPIQFQEVVSDTTTENIYDAVKNWFVDNFKDAEEVLQIDDESKGVLKGVAVAQFETRMGRCSSCVPGVVYYTVGVEIKADRYRVTIENFRHRGSCTAVSYWGEILDKCDKTKFCGFGKVYTEDFYEEIKGFVDALGPTIIEDLKTYVLEAQSERSDW